MTQIAHMKTWFFRGGKRGITENGAQCGRCARFEACGGKGLFCYTGRSGWLLALPRRLGWSLALPRRLGWSLALPRRPGSLALPLVLGWLGVACAQPTTTTVLFSTYNFTGQTLNNPIVVTPGEAAESDGNEFIAGPAIALQPTNGVAVTNLAPGIYQVALEGILRGWRISVPVSTAANQVVNAAACISRGSLNTYLWTNALAGVNLYLGGGSGTAGGVTAITPWNTNVNGNGNSLTNLDVIQGLLLEVPGLGTNFNAGGFTITNAGWVEAGGGFDGPLLGATVAGAYNMGTNRAGLVPMYAGFEVEPPPANVFPISLYENFGINNTLLPGIGGGMPPRQIPGVTRPGINNWLGYIVVVCGSNGVFTVCDTNENVLFQVDRTNAQNVAKVSAPSGGGFAGDISSTSNYQAAALSGVLSAVNLPGALQGLAYGTLTGLVAAVSAPGFTNSALISQATLGTDANGKMIPGSADAAGAAQAATNGAAAWPSTTASQNATNPLTALARAAAGSGLQLSGGVLSSTAGGGSVTSVGLSAPNSGATVGGSPVTGGGTLSLAWPSAVVTNGFTPSLTLTASGNRFGGNGGGLMQTTNTCALVASNTVVLLEGDSKMAGLAQVMTNLGWFTNAAWITNGAVGGTALSDFTNRWLVDWAAMAPHLGPGTNGLMILWGLANDYGDASALNDVGTLSNYLCRAASSNLYVTVLTVQPRADYGFDVPQSWAFNATINNWYRQPGVAWRVADISQAMPNCYDTNLFVDLCHNTALGYTNVSQLVLSTLALANQAQLNLAWRFTYGTNQVEILPAANNQPAVAALATTGTGLACAPGYGLFGSQTPGTLMSAAGWVPTNAPCSGWWAASDYQANGNPGGGSWFPDRSGNGVNFTNANASALNYINSDPGVANNPVLDSGPYALFTKPYTVTNPVEVMLVAEDVAGGSGNSVIQDGAGAVSQVQFQSGAIYAFTETGGAQSAGQSGLSSSAYYVFDVLIDGTGDTEIWTNGVPMVQGTTAFENLTTSGWTMGAWSAGKYRVAEIIQTTNLWTPVQRGYNMTYLQAKYGLSARPSITVSNVYATGVGSFAGGVCSLAQGVTGPINIWTNTASGTTYWTNNTGKNCVVDLSGIGITAIKRNYTTVLQGTNASIGLSGGQVLGVSYTGTPTMYLSF